MERRNGDQISIAATAKMRLDENKYFVQEYLSEFYLTGQNLDWLHLRRIFQRNFYLLALI